MPASLIDTELADTRPTAARGPQRSAHAFTGWMQAPDGRPWYPLSAMRRVGITVEVATEGGAVIQVRLGRHPTSRLWFWWEMRGPHHTEVAPLIAWRNPGLPPPQHARRQLPVAWRPLAGAVWPEPLPEPLAGPVYRPPPPPPEVVEESGSEPADGWPHPGLVLGCRRGPDSRNEVEARVLRGIRTMNTPGVVESGRGRGSVDSVVRVAAYALSRERAEAEHVDRSALDNAVVAWLPDRRDLSDWDYALDWWRQLDERPRRAVGMRGANPAYSWRQIGEALGLSAAGAQSMYRAAIARMLEIARASVSREMGVDPMTTPAGAAERT